MSGQLTISTTETSAPRTSLRYSFLWSAWLDGHVLGEGYGFSAEDAERRAVNLVTDTLTPDQVEHIKVVSG
ncbi:MAG: hypothetical protein M5U22_02505 [Thermoleophilia bacterium]|nr:hypothetical protein [Thermoleophilia bacterium]